MRLIKYKYSNPITVKFKHHMKTQERRQMCERFYVFSGLSNQCRIMIPFTKFTLKSIRYSHDIVAGLPKRRVYM